MAASSHYGPCLSKMMIQASAANTSAELKVPGICVRIRPEIFDFEPELNLKQGQTNPKILGTVPTDRHTTTSNDSGPIPACFDNRPKLLNCQIIQPSLS